MTSVTTTQADPAKPRFNRRSLLITALTACALIAVVVLSLRHFRASAFQKQCSSNLKQIGLALHDYYGVHKTFPSAITFADDGTPMHSWRVQVLPYLVADAFYGVYDFTEPWDGPRNRLLGDEVPDTWPNFDGTVRRDSRGVPLREVYYPRLYRCPSAPASQNRMCANYVMLIDDRPGRPNGPPNRPGSMPPPYEPPSSVTIIEIADSNIHWMEPRDVLLSELSFKINDRSKRSLSSYHGGACLLHADGTVEVLDDAATEELVKELLAQ
jgi:hypothetical protein